LGCSPKRAPEEAVASARIVVAARATTGGAAVGGERTWSLEGFTPLLAEPGFAEIAALADSGRVGDAAAKLTGKLATTESPPVGESVQWWFLLGRLREQAGASTAAAEAYEVAAAATWELADWARLGAARCRLRAGDAVGGLAHAKLLPKDPPFGERAQSVIAEGRYLQGELPEAIALWQQELEREGSAAEPQLVLRVARARADCVAQGKCDAVELLEALRGARWVLEAGSSEVQLREATQLTKQLLGQVPEKQREAAARPSLLELSDALQMQSQRGAWDAAVETGQRLLADAAFGTLAPLERCEARFLHAKALGSGGQRREGQQLLSQIAADCPHSEDVVARSLYLAGKFAIGTKDNLKAIELLAELERRAPAHRLADDARYLAATAYLDAGVEARFTELLSTIGRDYPQGDMAVDGLMLLAMRRLERRDLAGAGAVLEQAVALVGEADGQRGLEWAGRERYFLARVRCETGQKEHGLELMADILKRYPMSYYALHAFTRLQADDPHHAAQLLSEAATESATHPFVMPWRAAFDAPGFRRAMLLLRLGESEAGRAEIELLGLTSADTAPEVLWGLALLYDEAGLSHLANRVVAGGLTDWLGHWPTGTWERAWRLAFPRPFQQRVAQASSQTLVAQSLLYAIMREESGFDPSAQSPAAAYGLMQLIVPTARTYAKSLGVGYSPAALKEPGTSITLGATLLADLSKRFAPDDVLAIPAYNAGPGRPIEWRKKRPDVDFDVWVELIPFRETRRYTKRVLASRAAYRWLYEAAGPTALTLPLRLTPP
jgi:soluble lytic murein transglycosylase